MSGAFGQNLRREHAIDAKKLELDSITARVGSSIDKGQRPAQVAAMVGRSFSDEQRAAHLTKSKARMAKKQLTPKFRQHRGNP
jgi:hypothetical protein